MELHWLPIEKRIEFKTSILTYKCLEGIASDYLYNLIKKYEPERKLRSNDQELLVIPRKATKTLGTKSFYVSAPIIWNSLPLRIRQSNTLDIFKSRLKTLLFESYFVK